MLASSLFTAPIAMGTMPPPSALPATLLVLSLGLSMLQLSSTPAHASPLTTATASTAMLVCSSTAAVPIASIVAMTLAALLALPTLLPSPLVAAAYSVLQEALTLGESLTHLPAKLVQKILELCYVEMLELLSETWLLQQESLSGQNPLLAQFKRQKGPVANIYVLNGCNVTPLWHLSWRWHIRKNLRTISIYMYVDYCQVQPRDTMGAL